LWTHHVVTGTAAHAGEWVTRLALLAAHTLAVVHAYPCTAHALTWARDPLTKINASALLAGEPLGAVDHLAGVHAVTALRVTHEACAAELTLTEIRALTEVCGLLKGSESVGEQVWLASA
jgi:hypothetical protein